MYLVEWSEMPLGKKQFLNWSVQLLSENTGLVAECPYQLPEILSTSVITYMGHDKT